MCSTTAGTARRRSDAGPKRAECARMVLLASCGHVRPIADGACIRPHELLQVLLVDSDSASAVRTERHLHECEYTGMRLHAF